MRLDNPLGGGPVGGGQSGGWPDASAQSDDANGGGLDIFIRKLVGRQPLSRDDCDALHSLSHSIRRAEPNDYILREGDRVRTCSILLSGVVCRHKLAADGGRQIVAIRTAGDPLDLQSLHLDVADHNIQALTAVTLAVVPLAEIEAMTALRPAIGRALTIDMQIEASIGREWLLNIGRRNARARLAHFLCELVDRLHLTGAGSHGGIAVPVTQEQLADLLGLTAVHVNRTLRALEAAGGVRRKGRRLTISDVAALRAIAGYSDRYLHGGHPAA